SNLPATDGWHVSLWKVAVLHVLLGVATVWLTWLTARRLVASGGREPPETSPTTPIPITPLVAGFFVACDPILLHQQSLVMTETLATFVAILALWCLVRFSGHRYWWNAALAGGAIGLAALCRPTFLPWLGLVGCAMILDFRFQISDFQQWRQWAGRALPNLAALVVAAAAVMSPWAIRNQQDFGQPILTTTHGGYTLWLGNNPSFYDWLRNSESDLPWDVERDLTPQQLSAEKMLHVESLVDAIFENQPAELVTDAAYANLASQNMQRDPAGCALASLYRIGQLWSPLPHKLTADESTGRMLLRHLTAAWYCGVYLLSAVGAWRLRWKLVQQPWLWGVLLCLAFTAVHTLYWSNLRMRAPLMPFVALVAAAGLRRDGFSTAGGTGSLLKTPLSN
ncbi:MAG: hypothetical protein WD872_06365, partial [Pirellulaceae bacterium]